MYSVTGDAPRKKIAIVGTGIAGNVAAYLLREQHDITVYEAAHYVGGHTNTVGSLFGEFALAVVLKNCHGAEIVASGDQDYIGQMVAIDVLKMDKAWALIDWY